MVKRLSRGVLLLAWLALLAVPCAAAAGERPVFCVTDFVSRVAVTNLSGEQVETFHAVNDYFIEELSDADIELIDVTLDTTRARLDEQMLGLARGTVPPELAAVHPDYVIYGFLTNLGVAQSVRPGSNAYVVRADLSARVIEAATGRQVFTATGTGEASAKSYEVSVAGLRLLRFGTREFTEECLHEALGKATHQIAEKLKEQL
ncbi:MAG: hypothetical protein IJU05_04370 [Schwartzia sp.]|nr:hypothetical protein [Schwartzia sp. (in: firmicutes)]